MKNAIGMNQKCQNIARRFAAHLIDLGVVPAPVPTARQIALQQLRAGYEDYLHRQRGLSQCMIFHVWRFSDRFSIIVSVRAISIWRHWHPAMWLLFCGVY
jgi:hypothetical protein